MGKAAADFFDTDGPSGMRSRHTKLIGGAIDPVGYPRILDILYRRFDGGNLCVYVMGNQ